MNYKVITGLNCLRGWARALGVFCLVAVALYALLGFVILPELLKRQIETIPLPLNRPISIDKVQINPFEMTLTLHNLQIRAPDQTEFFSFKQLRVDLAVFESLQNRALTTESVTLSQPVLQLHQNRQNQLNIADLIALSTQSDTSDKGSSLAYFFQQIKIVEGKVSWRDDSKSIPSEESIYPLNMAIDNISSQADRPSEAQLNIEFASGGTLFWQGNFNLKPIESQGQLNLKNLDMHRIWQIFLQGHVPLTITKGRFSSELTYQMRFEDEDFWALAQGIQIELNQINVIDPDRQQLLEIQKLQARNGQFNLNDKMIRFDAVQLDQAQGYAWLDQNQKLNYQTLFPASVETESISSPQAQTWRIQIPQISGQDLNLTFTDSSRSPAIIHTLSDTRFDIQDFDTRPGTSVNIDIQSLFNRHSALALQGSMALDTLQSEWHAEIKNLMLPLLTPYQPKSIKLVCTSGWLDSQLTVRLNRQDDELQATATISGTVNDLNLKQTDTGKNPLQWQQLEFDKLQYTWPDSRLSMTELILHRPYLQAQVNPDKTLSWQSFMASSDALQTPDNDTSQPLDFTIDQIQIQNGMIDFRDASLQFPFNLRMQDLNGDIRNLSSQSDQLAKLHMSGQLDSLTPVTIEGQILPIRQEANVNLHFKNLSLPSMNPYMIEFAGRKVKKGKMKLDLNYLKENQALTLSNQILIEQLVLGEKVQSPNAVSLPLDFVLALLQDNQGNIELNVPIRGSLDQPDFNFAALIGNGLVNVVNKWITSPFSAIASLFESDEAEQVQFAAGLHTLSITAQQKLTEWTTVLKQRPEIQLEIKGHAITDQDSLVLQEQKLAAALQAVMPTDPQATDSPQSRRQQAVVELFLQRHPELADRTLMGEPRLLQTEQGDFYTVAEKTLQHDFQPDRSELQNLAKVRADQVAAYLLNQGIEADRIFVLEPRVDEEGVANGQVDLTLTYH
jgi:outer membrane protein OmpA-like peptidoglycan-associated protein